MNVRSWHKADFRSFCTIAGVQVTDASGLVTHCCTDQYNICSDKRQRGCHQVLAYITLGTNDFKRSVEFYDAVLTVLGYSRLPAWTESWVMWGDENNPDEGFSFCLCPTFDSHSATAGTGPCSHSKPIVRNSSDASMQLASLREE